MKMNDNSSRCIIFDLYNYFSFHVETEEEIEKRMSEVNIPIKVYTTFKERLYKIL